MIILYICIVILVLLFSYRLDSVFLQIEYESQIISVMDSGGGSGSSSSKSGDGKGSICVQNQSPVDVPLQNNASKENLSPTVPESKLRICMIFVVLLMPAWQNSNLECVEIIIWEFDYLIHPFVKSNCKIMFFVLIFVDASFFDVFFKFCYELSINR